MTGNEEGKQEGEGAITVKILAPVIMETKERAPTLTEWSNIQKELVGFIRERLAEMRRESEESNPDNLEFLFIEVDNAIEGEETISGNLCMVPLTPFPAEQGDVWRSLLVRYLQKRGLEVSEYNYGENHAIRILNLDKLDEQVVFDLLQPFVKELCELCAGS
jgi:hypothetical protein